MTEGYAKQFIGRRRELQELLPVLRVLATRIARKLETDGFIPIPVPSSKDNPLSAARLMQLCTDASLAAGLRQVLAS